MVQSYTKNNKTFHYFWVRRNNRRHAVHKIILMLLLIVVSSCAVSYDEIHHDSQRLVWDEVGINDDGATIYADLASIRKSGNRVKMWSLHDYKSVRNTYGIRNLSSRLLNEYDCKEEQVMMRLLYVHSGNMGRGEAIQINGEYCCWWSHVSSGTINETLWKLACGK